MDSLPDFAKIVIGLVVAVFWIIGKIAENKKNRQEEESADWEPDTETRWEEEDSFGNPLPPPIPQRHAPPPLPQFIPASSSELERQQRMQEQLRSLKKERTASSSTSQPRRKTPAVKPAAAVASTSIRSRLKNRSELRRAIVMREILDPPVGLR